MTNTQKHHPPKCYRIKLKEHLNTEWSEWFENMAISCEAGETILTGPLQDQAALHGLLVRIRDMNLTLLQLECLDSDRSEM